MSRSDVVSQRDVPLLWHWMNLHGTQEKEKIELERNWILETDLTDKNVVKTNRSLEGKTVETVCLLMRNGSLFWEFRFKIQLYIYI